MEAFKIFDLDGDGYISLEEAILGFKNIGEDMTKEEVIGIIASIDTEGTGKINYT
tara:strand:+ start:396 stop:560 length:165 start_codon:yes stop_codon:yes gene_type:complete